MLGLLEQIVLFDECHQANATIMIITGVSFVKDFGPWKHGQEVECLNLVSYSDGVFLETSDDDGKTIDRCQVELKVKQ